MKNAWRVWAGLSCALATVAAPAVAQDFNAAPPNVPDFAPAFAGQTRAPVLDPDVVLTQKVVASGLENPWGMAALPDGAWLVTERPGRMRIIAADGSVSEPISGLPEVVAEGQGGLLDVALRDSFAEDRRLWWSYAEPRAGGKNGTAVATGVLSADGRALSEVRVIFRQEPSWASDYHFGSRLVFAPDGNLFVTLGERSMIEARPLAQDLGALLGKVVRITPEGGIPADNPKFAAEAAARPEVYSYGHRNPQGAALDGSGQLWVLEHGPKGGDELNRVEPGRNYGWPVIVYGEEYSGAPIGDSLTQKDGMEQPVYYWDPVIAPSGLVFYQGDLFPGWKDSALIGGLAGEALVRLEMKDGKVSGEARYLQGAARVRDVDVAADGAVMILTDAEDGALIRLMPGE